MRRLVDLVVANVLFRLPITARKRLFAGREAFCPICETHVSGFLTLHRPYHRWCPVCRSLQRHRLIWLFLKQYGFLTPNAPQTMLHFAPESGLAARLARVPTLRYITADLAQPATVRVDITTLPFRDNEFDSILCSHVLEHVPRDDQAMRELYRVLKPLGIAMILVPIKGEQTIEDPSITDPILREQYFGQFDHVRIYGRDVVQRLQQAGFSVTLMTAQDIVQHQAAIAWMGLPMQETIFVCRKE
ncbi:MAG: class I SAM-dependent methyltransferase [Chloroflexus sp.]